MGSKVIYGIDFARELDAGLAPEAYDYRFLVEGDSWMDRSGVTEASLLEPLAQAFDAAGKRALLINLSRFGDTVRRMGDQAGFEFWQWLNTPFPWRFDGLLLSAGGNDVIDAARDPAPGTGLLKLTNPADNTLTEGDCFSSGAMDALVSTYMDPSFARLYGMVRFSRHHDLPIFLNLYDVPIPRPAPATPGGQAWLSFSLQKNGTPPHLWNALTDRIFIELESTVRGWANAPGRHGIIVVPTVGTLVDAAPGSTGNSNDWLNEIHPNSQGWGKLAPVWLNAIRTQLNF